MILETFQKVVWIWSRRFLFTYLSIIVPEKKNPSICH